MSLNAQIALSIVAHEHDTADLARGLRVTSGSYAVALTDGTGANQAQIAWSDSRTVGTVVETLTTTALQDTRDGASVSVTFSEIKAIYVKNTHESNVLVVTSLITAGTTPAPSPVFVPAGGVLFLCTPGATGKSPSTISMLGSASGTTYDIILIGEGTVT